MKGRDRVEWDQRPGAGGVGGCDQAGEDLEEQRYSDAGSMAAARARTEAAAVWIPAGLILTCWAFFDTRYALDRTGLDAMGGE